MKAFIDKSMCSGCRICTDECPQEAIAMEEVAAVKNDLCTGCGLCAEACPSGAISMKKDNPGRRSHERTG